MLIDVCEWPLSQIENRLDAKHPQLEVVTVEDICHVAHEKTVFLDF